MKLKITSLFLLLTLTMVSCKKQLDLNPYNAVSASEAFNTQSDFDAATEGMYYQMVHAEHYLGGADAPIAWVSTFDLLADNLISQQTGRGSQREFGNWQYNSSTAPATLVEGYSIIRAANAIVEHIDNLPADISDSYLGEALAVRAMVHFDLLRIYSKPLTGGQAQPSSLGVPYVTTTSLTDEPSRGTVKETYDQVVSDLTEAAEKINDDNGVGRLNKASVYGLLSRVYLYGGEWQKCADASTSCLNFGDNPGSIENFASIWGDATEEGVLFKVKITSQDNGTDGNIAIGVGYNQTSSATGVKSEWVCSYSLFQLYQSNDVRRLAYILPDAEFSGKKYNAIIKYSGKAGGLPNIVDVKYLRVAEILLNRAEAYSNLGMDANALTDLDQLRTQRYEGFSSPEETGQALQSSIALERRLELAFEGDRWFDLKRKGLPVERDQFGDFSDGTGTGYFVRNLPAGDYHWLIPFNFTDIRTNPNLAQNPGY